MTHFTRLAVALLLFSLTATAAQAGDAIEALAGDWTVEVFGGKEIPPGVVMTMTFVDDQTMTMTVTANGELLEEKEVRYLATEDGEITVFAEDDDAEDQSANWEISDDGKLHITADDDGEMILGRP